MYLWGHRQVSAFLLAKEAVCKFFCRQPLQITVGGKNAKHSLKARNSTDLSKQFVQLMLMQAKGSNLCRAAKDRKSRQRKQESQLVVLQGHADAFQPRLVILAKQGWMCSHQKSMVLLVILASLQTFIRVCKCPHTLARSCGVSGCLSDSECILSLRQPSL